MTAQTSRSPLLLIPRADRFYPGLYPGSTLSIGPGAPTPAISVPAVAVNLPHENSNGNGNGAKDEKIVKGAPKATRVVGSFDHPLLPMTPVSVATCTGGLDGSRTCRNG